MTPAHARWLSLGLCAAAAALFVVALTQPFVFVAFDPEYPSWVPDVMGLHAKLTEWLIELGQVPVGDHTIPGILGELWGAEEHGLAALVGLFSLAFPTLKLTVGAALGVAGDRMASGTRAHVIKVLGGMGKWSMADVFVVGFLIVLFKAEGVQFEYQPRPGLWAYAGSAVLATLSSQALLWRERALRRLQRDALIQRLFEQGRRLPGVPEGVVCREAAVFLREDV